VEYISLTWMFLWKTYNLLFVKHFVLSLEEELWKDFSFRSFSALANLTHKQNSLRFWHFRCRKRVLIFAVKCSNFTPTVQLAITATRKYSYFRLEKIHAGRVEQNVEVNSKFHVLKLFEKIGPTSCALQLLTDVRKVIYL